MKRFFAAMAAFSLMFAYGHTAFAQHNPLVGTWMIVSVNNERADGTKVPLFGPEPQGMLTFDAKGRYSLQLCSSGRPKFAANDRAKGTPEEYKAAIIGCNPHWGRYAIDEASKIITFKIDHATYANWEGTEQKRSFTLANGVLTYHVPNPETTGANAVVTWKRAP